MRLAHLFEDTLREFLDTSDLYAETVELIERVLKDAATVVVRDYKEGDYYAGEVLDRLSDALTGLLKRDYEGKVARRIHPVQIKMIPGNPERSLAHFGGRLTDHYHGVSMQVGVGKNWFDLSPTMFYYAVRDNGRQWARLIARVFTHEVAHLEQTLRGEQDMPADASAQARYGREQVRGRSADAKGDPYLSKKSEITTHAMNAAQELIDVLGVGRALSMFRQYNDVELRQWVRDGGDLVPHFSNFMSRMPEGAAKRRFLKLVYQYLKIADQTEPW